MDYRSDVRILVSSEGYKVLERGVLEYLKEKKEMMIGTYLTLVTLNEQMKNMTKYILDGIGSNGIKMTLMMLMLLCMD